MSIGNTSPLQSRVSRLDEFTNLTTEILGLARENQEMSNGVAEKFAGPATCGSGEGKEGIPTPSGLLGEWTERLRKVRDVLHQTRDNINRIDC